MTSTYYTCPSCGGPVEANLAANQPNTCIHPDCDLPEPEAFTYIGELHITTPGEQRLYLIRDTKGDSSGSRGWWMPDQKGYTTEIDQAGRYRAEDLADCCGVRGDWTIEISPESESHRITMTRGGGVERFSHLAGASHEDATPSPTDQHWPVCPAGLSDGEQPAAPFMPCDLFLIGPVDIEWCGGSSVEQKVEAVCRRCTDSIRLTITAIPTSDDPTPRGPDPI